MAGLIISFPIADRIKKKILDNIDNYNEPSSTIINLYIFLPVFVLLLVVIVFAGILFIYKTEP